MGNPNLENLVEKLQYAVATFCSSQQSAIFSQHLVTNLYNELYTILEENTLGKRLKKARSKLGLSQAEFASNCKLSRGAIANYEKDIIHPSRDALFKIGKIIDLDYLCSDNYSKFILSNYIDVLKTWRQKKCLSMRAAAKMLGVPPSTYIAWENQKYTINKDSYEKIKIKLKELVT